MARSPSTYRTAIRTLRRFGRAHRHILLGGLAGTVAVVALRLAMPWPLRAVMEMAIEASGGASARPVTLPLLGPAGLTSILVSFVAIGALLGLSELVQRVLMKRYAALAVRDVRYAAVRGLARRHGSQRESEVIARLIGDAARVKAELSGILVHVSQNFLLFVGVCVLFLVIAPVMAGFLLASGAFAIVVGYRSTRKVEALTAKQRAKEADYAAVLGDAVQTGNFDPESEAVNRKSAQQDVMVTRTIARASAVVHTGVALLTALALAFALKGVAAGYLLPGELFLFIAYALTVHRRLVQVGRQLARSGKLTANLQRIAALADTDPVPTADLADLSDSIELRDVRIGSSRAAGGRRRLNRTNLVIRKGSRVLVVGGTGSGKTSLLRAAAGLDSDKGELLWDGTPVSTQALARSGHVSFVAQNPVFRRTSLASLLGLPRDGDLEAVGDVLRACSIRKLVGRAPRGLATKVSSATLTVTEARGLSLCRLLIGGAGSVWIIDDPFAGSGRSRCEERLKAILDRAAERTVVISTRRPVSIESFDRVVVLKSGRVRFSGTPADFAALGRSQHHRDELRAAV